MQRIEQFVADAGFAACGFAGGADADQHFVGWDVLRRVFGRVVAIHRKALFWPIMAASFVGSRGAALTQPSRPLPPGAPRPDDAFKALLSMAGLLARESPPVAAFPGTPLRVAPVVSAMARRLQLRGQRRHRANSHRLPFSPSNSKDHRQRR